MRNIGSRKFWVVAAALLASAALPAFAQAPAQGGPTSAMDDRWHFVVAPYFWTSGIKGDVSVAGLPAVPVEASISDILSKFDIGLQGHFEGRKNRVGFGADLMWINLGADAASTQAATLTVDVRQLVTEGFVFYRVANGGSTDNPAHLDVLVGGRYTGTRTRLTIEPISGTRRDSEYQQLDWFDGMAGFKFRAPLGSRAAMLGRADVAGFGSNVTWNLEGDLAFKASQRFTLGAGWRYMDIDYDNGAAGIAFRQFKLAYSGPRLWFAYSW